jgi:hypothetical protein
MLKVCHKQFNTERKSSVEQELGIDFRLFPFRQDDPKWALDLMWDRRLVIKIATTFNNESKSDANHLLREFKEGNTIGNEGCMLTCLAMILTFLSSSKGNIFSPKMLNIAAQELYYYTPCGLSLSTLYGDLVADVSGGCVQLCLKEEYFAGESGWRKVFANTSAVVRAYRSLPILKRMKIILMMKTGTHDDTIASHYVLMHPLDPWSMDEVNVLILDPAQPMQLQQEERTSQSQQWTLIDSGNQLCQDREIARAWKQTSIENTQISGVYVFAQMDPNTGVSHAQSLIFAMAFLQDKEQTTV